MSSATKNLLTTGLLTKIDESKAKFSTVYMPMNTGVYKANLIALFVIPAALAYVFSMGGNLGA